MRAVQTGLDPSGALELSPLLPNADKLTSDLCGWGWCMPQKPKLLEARESASPPSPPSFAPGCTATEVPPEDQGIPYDGTTRTRTP